MANTLLSRKGSGKLLSVLLKSPKRKFSMNELSKEAGLPFGSAWNILRDWERFRVIDMERIGNMNAVSLGSGPHLDGAKKLLELQSSPQRASLSLVGAELRKKGVKEAFLFGSVAQGKEKPESDVDIALVSAKGFDAPAEAVRIYEKLAVKIVFMDFRNEKEMLAFLKGKVCERVV